MPIIPFRVDPSCRPKRSPLRLPRSGRGGTLRRSNGTSTPSWRRSITSSPRCDRREEGPRSNTVRRRGRRDGSSSRSALRPASWSSAPLARCTGRTQLRLWRPGHAASLAACGSAYGTGGWSSALAPVSTSRRKELRGATSRGLNLLARPRPAGIQAAGTPGSSCRTSGRRGVASRLRKASGQHRLDTGHATLLGEEVLALVRLSTRPQVILRLVNESCLHFSVDSAAADRLVTAHATRAIIPGLRSVSHVPDHR